ncbi:VOC family protein [Streptomyces sp. NPDC059256]|uniref:VOC family protein n=1 Tax=Streptomyces sp. NPDC059256 TaxID=3346794 RepID=UPI0036B91841
MAIAALRTIALDCPDPIALAGFYQRLLGGEITADGDDWVDLAGSSAVPLSFQLAPGHVPPPWPSSTGAQQIHLDLTVTDLEATEREVLAWGATLLDGTENRKWRVYADPAGHPFCLCAD